MATIDVRRAERALPHRDRLARLVAQLQLRRATTTRRTRTTGCCSCYNDDVVARRRRLRHAPAPRHGDRHVGARRRARAPRQRGQRRRDPTRARAAHERGHAASATPRRTRARPSRCTSCRCGCSPTRTGIAPGYEQRDVSDDIDGRRAVPARVRREKPTPRSRSTSATRRCGSGASRPARPSPCPTRRSCTCSSRAGRADARRRRRARHRATRCASPTPVRSQLTARRRRRRGHHLGDLTPICDSTLLDEARQAAVGEHLAAGLARRAVHDLVRLVRDALQVGRRTRGTARRALPCTVKCSPSLFCREAAGSRCVRARALRRAPRAARRAAARARRASAT